MEINRNQYFMAGIIFLLLGIQLRLVDSYVLTPEATKVLAKRSAEDSPPAQRTLTLFATKTVSVQKVVRPPDWVGWCLGSIGSVLILHSLAMKRPE